MKRIAAVMLALCVVSLVAADSRSTNSCFGIPCDFGGKLTPEQEKGVPSELCGAFSICSVRNISETDLQQILTRKQKAAEETRGGVKYIAVKDYRCVQFSKEVSGMMIVIERYRIVNKPPTVKKSFENLKPVGDQEKEEGQEKPTKKKRK